MTEILDTNRIIDEIEEIDLAVSMAMRILDADPTNSHPLAQGLIMKRDILASSR